MWLFTLLACGTGTGSSASIELVDMWPAEAGRFQAYRSLDAAQYADPEQLSTLDEGNLLLARFGEGGCGSDASRVELRAGEGWDGGTPQGALLVDDSAGLAICGWEDADGAASTYEPAAVLWAEGTPLREGEAVTTGGWTVTPRREFDVPTYFGTFPKVVAFDLSGSGALDGWTLHLASDFGLVLIENDGYTADLVYTR